MLRTVAGPVDIRKPRAKEDITLHGGLYGDKSGAAPARTTIQRDWLKREKPRGGHDPLADSDRRFKYRQHVLQALRLAAAKSRHRDANLGDEAIDPATGYQYTTAAERLKVIAALENELKSWKEGLQPVTMRRTSVGAGRLSQRPDTLQLQHEMYRERNRLVKLGSVTQGVKERYFRIDQGFLKVYKTSVWGRGEKPSVYQLAEAQARFEYVGMPGLRQADFHLKGYDYRVRVSLKEREGPLFLYSQVPEDAKNWAQAVRMSKFLTEPATCEALRYVVGRAVSVSMSKGWAALMAYANELITLRKEVGMLGRRLARADLSRGWVKARLVYFSVLNKEAKRREQMEWVNRIMHERLDVIQSKALRNPAQLRFDVVNKVQTKFRQYRTDRLLSRTYLLGSAGRVATRSQQGSGGARMGAAFDGRSTEEILRLVFTGTSELCLAKLEENPASFDTGRNMQSSVGHFPTQLANVQISESFQTLTFATFDELADLNMLAKSNWAHFVEIADISSVVLHTGRVLREKQRGVVELHPGFTGGTWFTINGPRICWGRRLVGKDKVAGSSDGFQLPRQLAQGTVTRWIAISVGVTSSFIPAPSGAKTEIPTGDAPAAGEGPEPALGFEGGVPSEHGERQQVPADVRQTFLVLSFLGRRFESPRRVGKEPVYFDDGPLMVHVPISDGGDGLAYLDTELVTVDVMEWIPDLAAFEGTRRHDLGRSRAIFSGRAPLWTLFRPTAGAASDEVVSRLAPGEVQCSLSDSLRAGVAMRSSEKLSVKLVQPWRDGREQLQAAFVELDGAVAFSEAAKRTAPVSPELLGCGVRTSLYTSARGAWYDPVTEKDSPIQHGLAPSFLEITLDELRFAPEDKPDASTVFEYRVEALCGGVTVASLGIHRATPVWSRVVMADHTTIQFEGAKMYVPLPPGCWCSSGKRPIVELTIVRSAPIDVPAVCFKDFEHGNGVQSHGASERSPVYRSVVQLGALSVDVPRDELRLYLFDVGLSPQVTTVGPSKAADIEPKVQSRALLACSFCLRDRDFARLNVERDLTQATVLCVGEKAMLQVEEPIGYPQSIEEFKLRNFPGEFSEERAGMHALAGDFLQLREPMTSKEYADSGLAEVDGIGDFKDGRRRKSYLMAQDRLPYRFVLPATEMEFRRKAKAGVYWRIVEKMVRDALLGQASPGGPGGSPPRWRDPSAAHDGCQQPIVEELSHTVKQVPVTVLAVYPNQTVDVEVDESFMLQWERSPDRHYHFPGTLHVKKYVDTSPAMLRASPVGSGDVGQRQRGRFLLQGVPLNVVFGVQMASFNIYDARFDDTEAAVAVHPLDISNGCQLRRASASEMQDPPEHMRRGGYYVKAGPLPVDVGAAAQHEWSLHLHVRSEEEMYQFVTTLRQSAYFGHALQQQQLSSARHKALTTDTNFSCNVLSSTAGHLEVVLVEARHLMWKAVQCDKDLLQAVKRFATPSASIAATFRAVDETTEDRKEWVWRGSKVQSSPAIESGSPSWATLPSLVNSGGWVFKTPDFNPGDCPGASFELEVFANQSSVGFVKLPLMGDPAYQHLASPGTPSDVNLCSMSERFNNLWLPLSVKDPATGALVEKICGEVHVMVLWVPMQQDTVEFKRLPKTAKAWRAQMLRPKLRLSEAALREPCTDLQASRAGYNPNLWRESFPRTRAEAVADYMELLEDNLPYLTCVERQAEAHWTEFCRELRASSTILPLGELRRSGAGTDLEYRLCELMRRGVPSTWRRHVWLEIFGADSLRAEFSQGNPTTALDIFKDLVAYGRPCKLDAISQLREDAVGAAAWERSTLPGAMERHMELVSKAVDVCAALIVFCKPAPLDSAHINMHHMGRGSAGVDKDRAQVCYCESLLALAFLLLVAMGPETEDLGHYMDLVDDVPKDAQLKRARSDLTTGTSRSRVKVVRGLLQREHDAERVFWMLYSLISTPAFRPYYAVQSSSPEFSSPGMGRDLASTDAAAEDVYRLNLCLAMYEQELWLHLEALGFQLSTVFYGAFLRLFAFVLPAPSLFRFWDCLFAEVTDERCKSEEAQKRKPLRHTLIDLAFGVVRRARLELLACQSPLEVKDCIVGQFETLCDPAAVIDIVADSEWFLWERCSIHNLVTPWHSKEFDRALPFWEQFFRQFGFQNAALQTFISTMQTAKDGMSESLSQSLALTGFHSGVTTSVLASVIIPSLLKAWRPDAGTVCGPTGGAFRAVPPKLRSLSFGPEPDKSVSGTLSSWASWVYEQATIVDVMYKERPRPPVPLPRPFGSSGEPTADADSLASQANKTLGSRWASELAQLYGAFEDRPRGRASLFELLSALICASKGTVGQKADALFQLYGYAAPIVLTAGHITPVSHSAVTILEHAEGILMTDDQSIHMAPSAAEIPSVALVFRVMVHATHGKRVAIGETYVKSLTPYITAGAADQVLHNFPIWELEESMYQGVRRGLRRRVVGHLSMSITWTPASKQDLQVGQLGIVLDSLDFSKNISSPEDKNPSVEVFVHDRRGTKVNIKRWDPRTSLQKVASFGEDMIYGEAFGEHIVFPQTKWRDMLGYMHNTSVGLTNHGWNATERLWMWDHRIGTQFSVSNFRFETPIGGSIGSSGPQCASTISLHSCRAIAEGILRRSFHFLTNRQAVLLADAAFSRCGAVPGLLDAVLVREPLGARLQQFSCLKDIRTAASEGKVDVTDVRHHIVLAYEESMSANPGEVVLFGPRLAVALAQQGAALTKDGFLNLLDLKIKDPYPGQEKALWIRYIRAGDGQRCNASFKVDRSGFFENRELSLDMQPESTAGKVQTLLTKQEFLSCLLSCPMLSEALRKSSTRDLGGVQAEFERSLNIDLAIADPTQEDADEDLLDALNVRQGICFEVYDSDSLTRSDFLGECQLPPFSELSSTPRIFALELKQPTEWSRPDGTKNAARFYTGQLFVEASWTFPVTPFEEIEKMPAVTLEERAAIEEKMHTGKLHVKILKAEQLRKADASSSFTARVASAFNKDSQNNDAGVWVYIKNEAFPSSTPAADFPPGFGAGGWRVNAVGKHEPIYRTKILRDQLIPQWNEEFSITLQTGGFERRTRQRRHFDLSSRRRRQRRNEALLATMESTDLLMQFGAGGDFGGSEVESRRSTDTKVSKGSRASGSSTPSGGHRARGPRNSPRGDLSAPEGDRHGVEVFMGDSIYEFMMKVREACLKEASAEVSFLEGLAADDRSPDAVLARKRKSAYEAVADNMSSRYVVLIFVPSAQLRELIRSRRTNTTAFKNLLTVEFADPASWQPLDTARSFVHYAVMYGYAAGGGLQLRLVEGTEEYQAKNSRYRQFLEDSKRWRARVEEVNNPRECFGYAKYVHRCDGDSEEWRPVLAQRCPSAEQGAGLKFSVTFIQSPVVAVSEARNAGVPGGASKVLVDEDSILLAPLQPRILACQNLELHHFLEQARDLQSDGLEEADIVRVLNERLLAHNRAKREAEVREGKPVGRPLPPITLRDVRHTLRLGVMTES